MAPPMDHEIPTHTLKGLLFARTRMTRREKRLWDMHDVRKGRDRDWNGRSKVARIAGKEISRLCALSRRVGGVEKMEEIVLNHGEF